MSLDKIFGESGKSITASLESLRSGVWTKEDGIEQHIHVLPKAPYNGKKPSTNPRLRIDRVLLNSANKARPTYRFDNEYFRSTDFLDRMADVMYSDIQDKNEAQIIEILSDTELLERISSMLFMERGVRADSDRYELLYLVDGLQAQLDKSRHKDPKVQSLYIDIISMILSANNLVSQNSTFQTMHLDTSVAVDYATFRKHQLAYSLGKELESVKLEKAEIGGEGKGNKYIYPQFFTSVVDETFSDIITALKKVATANQRHKQLMLQLSDFASGDIERNVDGLEAELSALSTNLSLVLYAFQFSSSASQTRGVVTAEAMRTASAEIGDFLTKSSRIQAVRVSDLAAHVTVMQTKNPRTHQVEGTLMATSRVLAAGRDVFFTAGEPLASHEKVYSLRTFGEYIDPMLPADFDFLSEGQCLNLAMEAIGHQSYNKGLVYDLTSTNAFDRKVFAMCLAISRSHKILIDKQETNKKGMKEEVDLGSVNIYYEFEPKVTMEQSTLQVSLNNRYYTMDPYEVIAYTGEITATKKLPGYNCQLRLEEDKRNLVDYSRMQEAIKDLSQPIYTTKFIVKNDKGDDAPVELKTTPLELADIKDQVPKAYATISQTNLEATQLKVRLLVVAWMNLSSELEGDEEKAFDDSRMTAVRAGMQRIAQYAFESMLDVVLTNPHSKAAVDWSIRDIANRHSVTKSYSRFYGDETMMVNVTLHVASVLLAHLQGLPSSELSTLHKMITSTQAVAWSMGSRRMSDLLKNHS
jgi:hypothetical protein